LAQWQDPEQQGDYFDAVPPINVGYLVWSQFPIKIYIEPVDPTLSGFNRDRAQAWVEAIRQAVQDWALYLPLELIDSVESANIQIWRSAPPLQRSAPPAAPGNPAEVPPASGVPPLPRVRSAETRYELLIDRSNVPAILSHRFRVYLSPNQIPAYTRVTARHELGHALGIWGHSPQPTDVMYFSQVRNPPSLSHRDINTLKRIYQQPTRVGWAVGQG
ncbi:MAG TPA: matrixin family metalloprotease, partial [Coleofasciculaceae cyanobacterium]